MAIIKKFLCFYAAMSKFWLFTMSTADLKVSIAEWVFAAFEQETGTPRASNVAGATVRITAKKCLS